MRACLQNKLFTLSFQNRMQKPDLKAGVALVTAETRPREIATKVVPTKSNSLMDCNDLIDEIRRTMNGNFILGNDHFKEEIGNFLGKRVTPRKAGRPINNIK